MTVFDNCFNSLVLQLEKATKFFNFTFKKIQATGDDDIIQLVNDFFIIKMFCIYEEFIRSIIFHGGIQKQKEIIEYFNNNDKEKKHQINDRKGLIIKLRKVGLYSDKCKKLKILFKMIFEFDFFPDLKSEKLFLDLILLRNVIIHAGSSIDSSQVKRLCCGDVVEKTSDLPEPFDFYKLRIDRRKFNIEITKGFGNLIFHIQNNMKQTKDKKNLIHSI